MKLRFVLFRRGRTFYGEDTTTGKQFSLRTKDEGEALTLLNARNESVRQPVLNLQIARTYLAASDTAISTRTWQQAIDALIATKRGSTQLRWQWAGRDKAFASLRPRIIIETQAEHLLSVLKIGSVSTNVHLRKLHNFCLDMGWLPWPVLPKRQWPAIEFNEKRAITPEEHRRILDREPNEETRNFYELLWHLGGSQSDVATLTAENVDWVDRVISYQRQKTGTMSQLHFGEQAAALLARLPRHGLLFPRLARMHERHRGKEFNRRCKGLSIVGVSLHSYRYAWAERAKCCGFPERFAQEALGHSSKAVHRAYARKAQVFIPALEEYERRPAGSPPPDAFTPKLLATA
jgi:integrase